VDLYQSTDQGTTWALLTTVANLLYPALCVHRSEVYLAGYQATPTGGASGRVVCSAYRLGTSLELLRGPITVGPSDAGRPAILRDQEDWSLRLVAPKTTTWTAPGATPGMADYRSTDSGKTWELVEIHA
jgi:hypothetical protein